MSWPTVYIEMWSAYVIVFIVVPFSFFMEMKFEEYLDSCFIICIEH